MNGFMWNPAEKLSIKEEERKTLKAWVAAKTSPQRTVLRAHICLLRNLSMKMRHLHKEFSVAMDPYFLVPVY
jgi:hypothetical protein